ncbi:MAG: hypothetical protein HY078_08620 [Elusimicrobia bacterium]|nr:hypothetical protein [Elusimicrobiota bacterium]
MRAAVLAFLLPVLPASAGEEKGAGPDLPKRPQVAAAQGWIKTPTSIALYDSSGTVVQELSTGQWLQEVGGERVLRVGRGGASSNGRFAWFWEQVGEVRSLRYMGTHGKELWRDELADAPRNVEPAAVSEDGETVLVVERDADGRAGAALYNYLGQRLRSVRRDGVIELAILSPGGRFALVRSHLEGNAPRYVRLPSDPDEMVRDPALAPPPTAALRIDDDGAVWAGRKRLHPARVDR